MKGWSGNCMKGWKKATIKAVVAVDMLRSASLRKFLKSTDIV